MPYSDLTVIVPALNEGPYIAATVSSLLSALPGAQVLVVDNGSTDDTVAKVHALQYPRLQVEHCLTRGKGAAMQYGLQRASTSLVLFHDADAEYEPRDSVPLVDWVRAHPKGMAVGVRQVSMGTPPWSSLLACALIRVLLQWRHGISCYDIDVLSGTRVAALTTFKSLKFESKGFSVETEIVRECARHKIEMHGTPVSYSPRTKSQGKKIGLMDIGLLVWQALR